MLITTHASDDSPIRIDFQPNRLQEGSYTAQATVIEPVNYLDGRPWNAMILNTMGVGGCNILHSQAMSLQMAEAMLECLKTVIAYMKDPEIEPQLQEPERHPQPVNQEI